MIQVHYRHVWNRYDDLMLVFFSFTFICWGASAADVVINDEVDLERPLWSQYDPRLVSELVFAVANLLAVIRLLFFLQITQAIGPLQASLLSHVSFASVGCLVFIHCNMAEWSWWD